MWRGARRRAPHISAAVAAAETKAIASPPRDAARAGRSPATLQALLEGQDEERMRRVLNLPMLLRPGSGLRQPFMYDIAAEETPDEHPAGASEPLLRAMQRAGATTGLLSRVELLASTQLPMPGDGGGHLDQSSCISPDGRVAYVAAVRGATAVSFDLDNGHALQRFGYGARGAAVTRLALSPSGSLLAVGFRCADVQEILLFDAASGTQRLRLRAGGINALAFTPDGATLLCTSIMDRKIAAFDLSTATARVFDPVHLISSACVLPAGALPGVRVAAFSTFGADAVAVYDVASGRPLLTAPYSGKSDALDTLTSATTPDGGLLAVNSSKAVDTGTENFSTHTRLYDTSRARSLALAPVQLQQACGVLTSMPASPLANFQHTLQQSPPPPPLPPKLRRRATGRACRPSPPTPPSSRWSGSTCASLASPTASRCWS